MRRVDDDDNDDDIDNDVVHKDLDDDNHLRELPALPQGRLFPRERRRVSAEFRQGGSAPKVLCFFNQSGCQCLRIHVLGCLRLRPRVPDRENTRF